MQQTPRRGVLNHIQHFESRYLHARNVTIWLPPGYNENSHTRYPVIYANDGQNLFEEDTAFLGVDWGIDEALVRLMENHPFAGAIVVGVWNTPDRYREYSAQRPFEHYLAGTGKESYLKEHSFPLSDNYLRFLTEELKPWVDRHYRTLHDFRNTSIMGSSMGGVISLYAICEYPHVFGNAACVSTHWPDGDGMRLPYMQHHLPDPASHKIYYDFGTETIDKPYETYQTKADVIMAEKGFLYRENWLTLKFPGADHSEGAWRRRVHLPLAFILGLACIDDHSYKWVR
jgi:predicted alpha/beta superfamily hydrolase